jgi:ribosomal subunit interface protein
MKTQVTFRHLKVNPDLNDAALEAAKRFEKFYDGITSIRTEFSEDNINKIAEFEVRVQGSTLVAKEDSDDFLKSLNGAEDKIVRQLRKRKTKEHNIKPIEV